MNFNFFFSHIIIDFYLVLLGVSILLNFILGFYLVFRIRKSWTSIFIFLFCLVSSILSFVSYFTYLAKGFTTSFILLLFIRSVLSLATFQALLIYLFSKSYPERYHNLNKIDFFFIIPVTFTVSVASLFGAYFQGFYEVEGVNKVLVNPAILVFAVWSIGLLFFATINLYKKYIDSEKDFGTGLILLGHILMFSSIVIFSFILPAIFEIEKYLPLSSAFSIPFVVLAISGLLKNNQLKTRITLVEIFVFCLWTMTFVRIFYYKNMQDMVVDLYLFFVWILFGSFFIKKLRNEMDEKNLTIENFKKNEIEKNQNRKILSEKSKLLNDKTEDLKVLNFKLYKSINTLKTNFSQLKNLTDSEGQHVKYIDEEILNLEKLSKKIKELE
jgi:hypothetical protein